MQDQPNLLGAAGRAAPHELCSQVSGDADFGAGMDARVQGCTRAAAANDRARRMHVLRAYMDVLNFVPNKPFQAIGAAVTNAANSAKKKIKKFFG